MDRTPSERAVSFRARLASPLLGNTAVNYGGSNNNNSGLSMSNSNNANVSVYASGSVAPGYVQLSPSIGSLRVRQVASHRRLPGILGPGSHGSAGGNGGVRSDNCFDAPIGTSPQLTSLLQRRGEDPLMSLGHRQRSTDSVADATSTAASPFTQSPVGAYPSGNFPTTLSRDSVMMHELIALQQQQVNQQKGVTVIYPQGASPTEMHMRMLDYTSMQEAQSNDEDNANEDRVQVRVEGFYEGANVNVLIPNDLPPSTLLYVLTASDGRDLMFKLTQYSLQLIICFLKMPSLFSPEVQVFTGPWAERLYRNYNTIRHGRSLFKMGRGLLNFFTVQTVCERMWMKYEGAIARQICAVLLPVVTRVEKVLLMLGASPVWGRAMSRMLLHRFQAAELTPTQLRLEESQDSMSMDWRIQERMKASKGTIYPGALLADDTFTHIAEVERGGNSSGTKFGVGADAGSSGHHSSALQGNTTNSGALNSVMGAGFTDRAMNAMGFATARGAVGTGKYITAAQLPSQPVLPRSPAEEDKSSPHSAKESFSHESASATPQQGSNNHTALEGPGSGMKGVTAAAAAGSANAAQKDSKNTPSIGRGIESSTSSSADDGPAPKDHPQTPPFVRSSTLLLPEHDHLPGVTPSTHTGATQPSTIVDVYDGMTADAASGSDGGRVTLLHPLPQSTQHSSTTDIDNSVTGDDGFGMQLDSTPHEDIPSVEAVGAANASREPMSMPENWRPAMAPTVPPSHSDEFGYGATLCFPDHAGSPPRVSSPNACPLPLSGHTEDANPLVDVKKRAPLTGNSEGGTVAGAAVAATTTTGGSRNGMENGSSRTFIKSATVAVSADSPHRSKKGCPPFEVVPATSAGVVATSLLAPASASSSLSTMPKPTNALENAPEAELNESEMSILSSEANSSFHVRPSGISGAMTTWLNELQPASAALPARLRKGVLQFNPILMTLLGIRNLAAGLRRFLRDACLISTERFTTFTFIEVHRRSITRFINRCWFIVSIIDLILNTVRLLDPGWTKYATARQNIRCRCGCQGDEDPADSVWRTHGFIARRKTDLFFPPLNLDYGAPFVSCISYMEAADPARLMPACSRCGCLYKELPSEVAMFDVEQGVPAAPALTPGRTVSLRAAVVPSLTRSTPAHSSQLSETPFAMPTSRNAAGPTAGECDGDRSVSMECEKPRWVQMYEAELQETEGARHRKTAAQSNNNNNKNIGGSRLTRREAQKPNTGTKTNLDIGSYKNNGQQELVDFALPPSLLNSDGATAGGGNNGSVLSGGNKPLKPFLSCDDNEKNLIASPTAASSSGGSDRGTTGILFVPWMMRKFFDYVWLLRVHPNLTATILLEARYLAEFYLSYKYCFSNYETYTGDAPLSAILHPYGAIAGIVSAAVGLLRVVESAPTS